MVDAWAGTHVQFSDGWYSLKFKFEQADVCGDETWFAENWPRNQHDMGLHALATYPIFNWAKFRQWLHAVDDDNARRLARIFNNEDETALAKKNEIKLAGV